MLSGLILISNSVDSCVFLASSSSKAIIIPEPPRFAAMGGFIFSGNQNISVLKVDDGLPKLHPTLFRYRTRTSYFISDSKPHKLQLPPNFAASHISVNISGVFHSYLGPPNSFFQGFN